MTIVSPADPWEWLYKLRDADYLVAQGAARDLMGVKRERSLPLGARVIPRWVSELAYVEYKRQDPGAIEYHRFMARGGFGVEEALGLVALALTRAIKAPGVASDYREALEVFSNGSK